MAKVIKQITVDFAKKNLFRAIVAKQYDNKSRFLKVAFANEGKPVPIDSRSSVIINAERADGQSKSFAGHVNDEGTVTVPLTSWMLELDDFLRCDISIISADASKLTSTSFTIEVEAAANLGEDVLEDENYDILLSLIADCIKIRSECETAANAADKSKTSADAAASQAKEAADKAKEATDRANTSANEATEAANAAATNAGAAANRADNSASAANTAAAQAASAADSASAAGNTASEQADAARQAAQRAETAAGTANTAAASASTAASEARTAAASAFSAAQAATSAVAQANEAAGKANTAADTANKAAGTADASAAAADEAAQRANTAADEAEAAKAGIVQYNAPQSLTEDERTQARGNIGAASEESVNQLSEQIDDLENEFLVPGDVEIPIEVKTDGYYGTTGVFYPTSDRQYAVIEDVDVDKVYKLTTRTQSAVIAGAIYFNDTDKVIGYELLGTGTWTTYDKQILNVPANCKKMIVQSTTNNTKHPFELYEVGLVKDESAVKFVGQVTVRTGPDLINASTVIASGFSGDKTTGFTHEKTTGGVLQFYNANITTGEYILEFDTNYTAGEFVKCGFANDYKNLAYNGGQHIVMPIRNTDGNQYLYIESTYDGSYTISNVKLKKVNPDGAEEVTFAINSTIYGDNKNNLGFWNVVLGHNVMDAAVGSTRSVAIGNNALGRLEGGHRNIAIGTFVMSQMTGGEGNVSIGADSMLGVKEATHNVMIGREAGYNGTNLDKNVAIGHSALFGSGDSRAYYNVAIGASAGHKCTSHRGVFVGYQAGYNITSGYGNTMLGFNTLGNADGYDNTCIGKQANFNNGLHNSTAIGANAVCKKSHQVVLGDTNISSFVVGDKEISFNEDGTVTWKKVE